GREPHAHLLPPLRRGGRRLRPRRAADRAREGEGPRPRPRHRAEHRPAARRPGRERRGGRARGRRDAPGGPPREDGGRGEGGRPRMSTQTQEDPMTTAPAPSAPAPSSPAGGFGFRTRALHAGGTPDAQHGSRAVPIYQTTSFVFDDADDAGTLFALQKYGNIYSRIGNPTVAAFEERIASLEGGIGAVATASGMSAEFITFAALAGAGDHIVASAQLYGGTVTQLDVTLRRFGVETSFVASSEAEDYRAAFRPETKALYVEVIGNPSGEIADLEALADLAHEHGVPLVVDATLATPYLVRPIEHGADIVIHSATKFLGGHGTTLGGVVVES